VGGKVLQVSGLWRLIPQSDTASQWTTLFPLLANYRTPATVIYSHFCNKFVIWSSSTESPVQMILSDRFSLCLIWSSYIEVHWGVATLYFSIVTNGRQEVIHWVFIVLINVHNMCALSVGVCFTVLLVGFTYCAVCCGAWCSDLCCVQKLWLGAGCLRLLCAHHVSSNFQPRGTFRNQATACIKCYI